ncbi:SAM-dependent methyltransferase [Streptomyces marispadix]|uniref:S-adenosyl-L-methionine-dependent methyltransferase n=1 Tax=Streptomyces marispadix TaxID=2922868 RepID=A0ABS9T287_9ACTN|nr:SAM-dependent methyltransferase [Streptomyces marispadix]MCH6162563.1 SAM-dependent methyltransferase [Streptomyces marispadix]
MSTDQQWDIVTGVGLTALAVAAGRAAESARPDALIRDPYASRLVAAAQAPVPFPFADGAERGKGAGGEGADSSEGAEGSGAAVEERDRELWTATSMYVGLRSRVFDDYFLSASEDGVRQVVILASGLDTRPYRLSWPSGTVCFELDQPAVLDFKSTVLKSEEAAPCCDHRLVPVDLRDDWGAALESAGFDPSRPTAWLAEGLLPYLPPEAETRLFEEVSRLSAEGSRFAVERIDDMAELLDDPVLLERSESYGMDFRSLFPEGDRVPVENRLTALGWELEHRSVPESAAALGRPEPGLPMLTEHVTHTFGRLG